MNRAERCRQARQKKQISDEIKQAVLRQAEQQLNDGRVEAILVCTWTRYGKRLLTRWGSISNARRWSLWSYRQKV